MSTPLASEVPPSLQIPASLLIEGVALGIERGLANNPDLVEKLANTICARFEVLTPAEAAALLGVTTRTLADNHVEWGMEKSVALGTQTPRYFLSQVISRAREKCIKGKRPANVTPFAAATTGMSQPAKTGTR
jgi:hypothetical protein